MEKHLLHLVRVFDQIRRFEFDFVWPEENCNSLKNENETYMSFGSIWKAEDRFAKVASSCSTRADPLPTTALTPK